MLPGNPDLEVDYGEYVTEQGAEVIDHFPGDEILLVGT